MRATSADQDLDAPIAWLGDAVAGEDGQLALASAVLGVRGTEFVVAVDD